MRETEESDPKKSKTLLGDHIQELSHWIEKVESTILSTYFSDDESGPEISDEETQSGAVDSALQGIFTASKCLMELLPSLQRTAKSVNEASVGEKASISTQLQVAEPAHAFVSQVLDKFENINLLLAKRLGQANWERHRRFLRQLDTAVSSEEPKGALLPEEDQESDAPSLFRPFSMFHDSGIGSSQPTKSSYAMSNASHASFLTGAGDEDGSVLQVPETPPEVGLGKPFECDLCGHLLFKIKNRIDWK